jgi:2-polyprenyl-3-methyl-5-hydroxy-6-metoxy-1,4-benzoquinol methylase
MVDRQTLMSRAAADGGVRELLDAMYVRNEWLLKPMLQKLEETQIDEYLKDVQDIWSILQNIRPVDRSQRLAEVIKGLQFHSIEFLKLQIKFAGSGQYQSSTAEQIYQDVYLSGDKMQQYLDGLLLTFVAWPNRYRLFKWYQQKYLAEGPWGNCLEIGPGHGWLAAQQLMANPSNRLLGLDISPHSVKYARQLLQTVGIEPIRYDIREHDAHKGIDPAWGNFDRVVIAEVLEHVEDPGKLLGIALERSNPQARYFITTVVNIEAPDHIYLFRELQEVRDLLNKCRLEVLDELDMPLEMNLPLPKPAFEVALICKPKS